MTKPTEPIKRGPGRPKAPPTVVVAMRWPKDLWTALLALGGQRVVKRVMQDHVNDRRMKGDDI